MTSFAWWASLVPDGQAMCCLCFEAKPFDLLYVDDAGARWDVCLACRAEEVAGLARRAFRGPVPGRELVRAASLVIVAR